MRITQQLLRSKANCPLQTVEYLDLSGLGLTHIERLNGCPKLQTLNLRGNSIIEVTNLEQNRHLWKLDLSGNEIKDLDCLCKFIALGTLNLANNDISWHEVGKLRHLHILDLSLHGNKQLERDPYYRIHVIDCLPHVWMLDGRVITSSERLQVKHFFADSALTDHPIRRKLSKEWFVPTPLKKIEVNGVYGEKATHVMIRFPANGPSNIETDKRRLRYLAHNIQEDMVLEKRYTKRDFQVIKYRKTFIEDILEVRASDRERCNMLLLLLVATLEFVMPTHLVKETLETAKLSKVGKVYSMDLFLLPKDVRCRIVCILLGAVKIDKDCKEDGGLYDRLYLCLFYTVAELSKLCNTIIGRNSAPSKTKMTQLYRDYKCLLASEIVQLLCIVPTFFEYVDKDVGVMNLVVTATGDPMITEKVNKLSQNIQLAGGDVKKLYEELSDFLLQKVQDQSMNLTNKSQNLSQEDIAITTAKSIPMKSPRSPLDASDFHAKGITSPNLDPPSVLSARRQAVKSRKHFPHLGDYLLLGPQTLGKVIGLPQPFVAHVAMDSIPVANGAMESKLKQSEDHYTYVNMDQFDWDTELNFWKPRGSIGDSMLQEFLTYSNVLSRFTIHTIEDLRKELNRRANLSSDHIPRPNSPEERPYSMTSGRESATPLIFSPGGLQAMSEEYMIRKPHIPSNDFSPRPMTSLLKEKLDLKLDLSSRRVQSAGPLHSMSQSPGNPPVSPENKTVTIEDGKEMSDVAPADCVHCAIAAAMAKDADSEKKALKNHVHETPGQTQVAKQEVAEGETTAPEDTSAKEANKENAQPPDTVRTEDSLAQSDEELELQNLTTSRTEPPSSVRPTEGETTGVADQPHVKSSSSLQINIPQVEVEFMDGGDNQDDKGNKKGRAPVIRGRQPMMSSRSSNRSSVNTGRIVVQGKNRPFSAMDAYRYIVNHPRKPSDSMYNTSYQQQRMEAWRQSASASQSHTPRQNTPPPQRPSSPDAKTRPTSSVSVQRANDWLGGGRDLYWESIQKRPRSGHVPGWKEGLPDSMKRPRSAAAARSLNRQSKSKHPVTPSSLAYEAMMQGGRGYSPHGSLDSALPNMMDLTDYQPLYHNLGLPRRLGSAGLGGFQDVASHPTQDMVYRMPPSSPTRQKSPVPCVSPGSFHTPVNMICVYSNPIDEVSSEEEEDMS